MGARSSIGLAEDYEKSRWVSVPQRISITRATDKKSVRNILESPPQKSESGHAEKKVSTKDTKKSKSSRNEKKGVTDKRKDESKTVPSEKKSPLQTPEQLEDFESFLSMLKTKKKEKDSDTKETGMKW